MLKNINKKAFTLVELIVVITILAILGTISFISFLGYTRDANNSKIIHDITSLNTVIESKLSQGIDIEKIIKLDRTNLNGVDNSGTVFSGSFKIGDLKYQVGVVDYRKVGIKGDDFKYNNTGEEKDYIFGYLRTPKKIFYEYAGEIKNQSGKYDAYINGNYIQYSDSDVRGLISESGSSNTGLKRRDHLEGSLWY